jgi:hypothetical protein
VKGDIREFGEPGSFTNSVLIQRDGLVKGDIWESDAGRVVLSDSRLKGDVVQRGDDDPATNDGVSVLFGSFLRGDVDCGGGFLYVSADSEHKGDAVDC